MKPVEAARILRPGTNWNYSFDPNSGQGILSQAEDAAPRVSVPLDSEIKTVMDSVAYIDKRVKEYPSLDDQLDAIWKGGSDMEDMRSKIQAIKTKYPKPS